MNWRPWAAVCVALVICGTGYRLTMAKYGPPMAQRIVLPIPLSLFPTTIGAWVGQDKPLSKEVEQIAGNDDYINRLYVDNSGREWVSFYIAYSGRPRTMVGHRPQVCYISAGWVHDATEPAQVGLASGASVPCLVHRFHQPPPRTGDMVVLNYYVLNGITTNNEEDFTGVSWRLPNIQGNPAWYVAQIEISSTSEAAVRRFAALTGDEVLARLPDRNGQVAAAFTRDRSASPAAPAEAR